MALRFTTAGESHGPGLTCIVEGLPAGLRLEPGDLDRDLARRQLGHGRGGRMKIESDAAVVTAGLRHGRTLGSPVALQVVNRDYANWEERMNPWPVDAEVEEVHLPRPGHADLAGVMKYGHADVRNVLERASARETAARVAAGGLAKAFLRALGVQCSPTSCRSARCACPKRRPATTSAPTTSGRRRVARPLPGPRRLGRDGRGDQPPAQGQRVARRDLRGSRLRARPGYRVIRLLGGAPGRSPGSGHRLDSRHEGRVDRRRASRWPGGPVRRSTTRSSGRRTPAGHARPTAREASRAG